MIMTKDGLVKQFLCQNSGKIVISGKAFQK